MTISTSVKTRLADDVIELVIENIGISELFDDTDIMRHVKGNLKAECIEWIQSENNPEDVFPDSELSSWAYANGWVKE
jgi:hypothetical protein